MTGARTRLLGVISRRRGRRWPRGFRGGHAGASRCDRGRGRPDRRRRPAVVAGIRHQPDGGRLGDVWLHRRRSDQLPVLIAIITNTVSLSATQSFWVGVIAPQIPRFDPAALTGGALVLTIAGSAGPDYIIEGATNLVAPAWQTLFYTNAPALPLQWWDTNTTSSQFFYRVLLGP